MTLYEDNETADINNILLIENAHSIDYYKNQYSTFSEEFSARERAKLPTS